MSFYGKRNVIASRQEIFTATEGQTVFTLSESYNANLIEVYTGGVRQFAPNNFTLTSPTSITLTEGVTLGTEVVISY